MYSLRDGTTLAQPGEAPPEWVGIEIGQGDFVGYNTFPIDASGSGPASVTVEVLAPTTAAEDLKVSARYWGCALGLWIPGANDWFPTIPALRSEDFPNASLAADGTTPLGWYSGTLTPGG